MMCNVLSPYLCFTIFYNDNKCCSILCKIVTINLLIEKSAHLTRNKKNQAFNEYSAD